MSDYKQPTIVPAALNLIEDIKRRFEVPDGNLHAAIFEAFIQGMMFASEQYKGALVEDFEKVLEND